MPHSPIILAAGLLLAAAMAALTAYWTMGLAYVLLGVRNSPRVDPTAQPPPAGEAPLISVIIPAHNEQRIIDQSLTDLRKTNWPNLEIVIAADRCTDETVAIVRRHAAEDGRIRLVEISECPEGWAGKCHACYTGYHHARGEWLLFTDADTSFHAGLITASWRAAMRDGLDMISLLGKLRFEHEWERVAQPIATMQLIRIFPIHRANRAEATQRKPLANGQFLLFRRAAYEGFGTHERVRDALLEDLKFARRMTNQGFRIGIALVGRSLRVSMYETQQAFESGWKRILTEAANRNVPRLRAAARRVRLAAFIPALWAVGLGFGLATLDEGPWLAGAVLGLTALAVLTQTGVLAWTYALQGAKPWMIWRYPQGCLAVGRILSEAADDLDRGIGITWGGKTYDIRAQHES